jgi:hypothetical protein
MASFQDLPQEMLDGVFQHCSRDDLRACHLTSRTFSNAVRPQLFREIHLSLEPRSWTNVQTVSADKDLRSYVQKLVLHPCLLPTFPDKEAWLLCVDVRPFRGKFYYDILAPDQRVSWMKERSAQDQWLREAYDSMPRWPENVHGVYERYLAAVESQKCFTADPEFRTAFRKLVQSFPRLHTLREAPWYEGWFGPPFARRDGTLDEVSWYLDMLKPKDHVLFKSEDLEEVWDETDVCRSSVLQARTIASQLVVHGVSSPEGGFNGGSQIREVDISVSMDGFYASSRVNELGVAMGEAVEYMTVMGSCLHSFETCNISRLVHLRLTIVNGLAVGELESLLPSLRKLLDTATSLTRLALRIRTSVTEYDFLEFLCQSYMPNLAAFNLVGATTSEKCLNTFLHNHASTLKALSLHEVYLPLGTGTWIHLMISLPKITSLHSLEASCLIDNGNHSPSYSGFIGPDSLSLPGLQSYVCHGGPWLGLTSVMDDSCWQKSNVDEEADSGWDWSGPSWSMRHPFTNSSSKTADRGWYREA